MNTNEQDLKRARIACDNCRRRKIKCSGENPCSNCINSKKISDCTFTEKIKQSRLSKPKETTKKRIKLMENKLNRLEDLISSVNDRLDYLIPSKNLPKSINNASYNQSPLNGSPSATTAYTSISNSGPPTDKPNYIPSINTPKITTNKTSTNNINSINSETTNKLKFEDVLFTQENGGVTFREKFFESHSFFSICSTKSLQWMSESLKNPNEKEYINHFKRLPYYFFNKSADFFKKFIDPIDINQSNKEYYITKPIHLDKDYIMALLELIVKDNSSIVCLVSYEDLTNLAIQYFTEGKTINKSNLLLLCSTIALCLNAKINAKNINNSNNNEFSGTLNPILDKYSNNELYKEFDDLYTSAILLYHRVAVISIGYDTIRAILMLVTTFEASGSMTMDINYLILGTAIRYAQEIGLHKSETYFKLDNDKVAKYRQLWEICLHLDIEFCFRHGKQPIINTFDNIRSSSNDLNIILKTLSINLESIDYYDPETKIGFLKPEILKEMYQNGDTSGISKYCQYSLSKLRFYSYFNLFANVETMDSIEDLENLLQNLNSTSLKVIDSLTGEFKPRFYDEPEFEFFIAKHINKLKNMKDTRLIFFDEVLSFQFVFFFQLMVTNRVPFLTNITDETPHISNFRKISIKSARTILYLALKCEEIKYQSFSIIWLSFYPFAAFLVLSSIVLNHPQKTEVKDDIDLLVNVSNSFFNLAFNDNIIDDVMFNLRNNRFGFQCVIMKIFLRIILAVIESKGGVVVSNELHNNQIALLKSIAPEIFSNQKVLDLKLVFSEMNNLSPKSDFSPRSNASYNSLGSRLNSYKASNKGSFSPNEVQNSTLNQLISSRNSNVRELSNSNPNIYNIDRVNSPSYNPSLANIINPEPENDRLGEFLNNQLNEFVNNQIDSLPNFFIDNNLGFEEY